MGLFTNRKKKKELKAAKIDDAFSRVYSQIEGIDTWNPKKLEHYILDSCEQIIASTKELEKQKTEYRIVTQYLNDIKAIENMPKEEAKILRNTASKICELEESILSSKGVSRNITEEQFEVISSDEKDMPEIINRYIDNEIYQAKIKRSLSYMEGEKSRWEIDLDPKKRKDDDKNLLTGIIDEPLDIDKKDIERFMNEESDDDEQPPIPPADDDDDDD